MNIILKFHFLLKGVQHWSNLSCHCLYAPSQSDDVWSKFFTTFFASLPTSFNNFFIGDFNAVLVPTLDRKNTSTKIIADFMLDNAAVDPWRTSHPEKLEFSWNLSPGACQGDEEHPHEQHTIPQIINPDHRRPTWLHPPAETFGYIQGKKPKKAI